MYALVSPEEVHFLRFSALLVILGFNKFNGLQGIAKRGKLL